MHQSIVKTADQYFTERKRRVYITSSNFVRIFAKFIELVNQKSMSIESELKKFRQGISNLDSAKETIDQMQDKIEALKPVLDLKTK